MQDQIDHSVAVSSDKPVDQVAENKVYPKAYVKMIPRKSCKKCWGQGVVRIQDMYKDKQLGPIKGKFCSCVKLNPVIPDRADSSVKWLCETCDWALSMPIRDAKYSGFMCVCDEDTEIICNKDVMKRDKLNIVTACSHYKNPSVNKENILLGCSQCPNNWYSSNPNASCPMCGGLNNLMVPRDDSGQKTVVEGT